jgi:hypothetical protein
MKKCLEPVLLDKEDGDYDDAYNRGLTLNELINLMLKPNFLYCRLLMLIGA